MNNKSGLNYAIKYCVTIFLCLHYSLLSADLKNQKLNIVSGKALFTLVKTTPQGDSKMSGLASKISGNLDLQEKKVNVKMDIGHENFQLSGQFKFANNRMHETYMESKKYPQAGYSGRIVSFDPGSGKASALGSFTLHGVTKENVALDGTIEKTTNPSEYLLVCSFSINLNDYKIPVPDIKLAKVNEIVQIKVKFVLREAK